MGLMFRYIELVFSVPYLDCKGRKRNRKVCTSKGVKVDGFMGV